jgi:hypothetical protein
VERTVRGCRRARSRTRDFYGVGCRASITHLDDATQIFCAASGWEVSDEILSQHRETQRTTARQERTTARQE